MDYSFLTEKKTSKHWQKIGTQRRAGICIPLFSVYTEKSVGVGEFRDIKILVDWCKQTGFSIIQLLPLNALGEDFSPYNAESSFAIEPMYLTMTRLKNIKISPHREEIKLLKKKYSKRTGIINYSIKAEKLKLLRKIFRERENIEPKHFEKFKQVNKKWLDDYVLYQVLKEKNNNKNREKREDSFNRDNMEGFLENNKPDLEFHKWVQWQCYEQLRDIKKYANHNGVFIMGDVPLLTSRDSADVWADSKYFRLDLCSGAPPDVYMASGQRWGMPPHNWEEIEKDDYKYISRKLKYAENFYNMYRIDHFVGLFRIWTINKNDPVENKGLNGKFVPEDINQWEWHGKKILNKMLESPEMLPCAEDLGTVPACSFNTIDEYGIPGMNVQRWMKNWDWDCEFAQPEFYRPNAVSTVSTHDSSTLPVWLEYEAGGVDETAFMQCLQKAGFDENRIENIKEKLFDLSKPNYGKLIWKENIYNEGILSEILQLNLDEHYEIRLLYRHSYLEKEKFFKMLGTDPGIDIVYRSLEKCSYAKSVFCIQQLIEYLFLDERILKKFAVPQYRINKPGTISPDNWSILLPFKLEELFELKINDRIRILNEETKRI